MEPNKRADAVFEGGGVKGIALAGAISVTEQRGYTFENVAGTSAGAIVAALVAAGYTASELEAVIRSVDYQRFLDRSVVDEIPLIGPVLSLGFEKGIYEGRFFEGWLRELLVDKRKVTFGDLIRAEDAEDARYRYRLQVIAADVSLGKLLVLPGDIAGYGMDPNELEIAVAVRMSMSIPFFFEPVKLRRGANQVSYIVDGGVLSNFPVWLFDDNSANPPWPTFGYKLVDPQNDRPHDVYGPISLFKALFSTMMEAHDARYIKDDSFVRTIAIPTVGVRATDFDIKPAKCDELFQSGVRSATQFFDQWDFERYKARYRKQPAEPRRVRVR